MQGYLGCAVKLRKDTHTTVKIFLTKGNVGNKVGFGVQEISLEVQGEAPYKVLTVLPEFYSIGLFKPIKPIALKTYWVHAKITKHGYLIGGFSLHLQ